MIGRMIGRIMIEPTLVVLRLIVFVSATMAMAMLVMTMTMTEMKIGRIGIGRNDRESEADDV